MDSKSLQVSSTVRVQRASLEDQSAIKDIQDSHLLKYKSAEQLKDFAKLSESGFFVHPLKPKELDTFIRRPEEHIVYVAQKGNEVIGYIVANHFRYLKDEYPNWQQSIHVDEPNLKLLQKGAVLYIRHVACRAEYKGQSIGRKLEEAVVEEARRRGFTHLFAEVLEQPYVNLPSTALHKNLGYQKIGIAREPDGKVWALFIRKI